jgi:hypothetical protein
VRRINLTRQFQLYRETTRFIWNTVLREVYSGEDRFPEIDKALFHVILEDKLDRNLEPSTYVDLTFYNNLEVRSPDKLCLVRDVQPTLHYYHESKLPGRSRLRYAGLFDFDWTALNRDFEYLECISTTVARNGESRADVLLVKARTAKIWYVESD